MSSFADILKQEYKSKGLVGGLASGTGKKTLELIDIRNALFGGSGVGSIVGRKLLGKGYSATADRGDKSPSSLSSSENALSDIRDNSIISAKNSMALPLISNQINIMQKNIAKLVKLQGGTPSQKADAFFSSAKIRESAYEASLKKKSPTQVLSVDKKDSSGGLLTALGLAGAALLFFGKELGRTAQIIGGVLVGLVALKGILMAIAAAKGIGGLIGMSKKGKKFGRGKGLFGLLAGGLLGYNLTKDEDGLVDEFGEPMNQGMSGLEGALLGAGAGLGVIGAKKFIQPSLNARTQAKVGERGFNEKAGRFTQNKSFTSAKNMPLTQTLEGLRKYYIRISATPGLRGFILKKLTSKFGIAVVLRLSTFLAGFAAAPFTAGLSTLISLASWGLTAYTLYEIYDYLFGEDNNGENMIKEYEALQAKEQNQSTLQKEIDSKSPIQLAGPEMPAPGTAGTEGGEQQKQAIHPRTGRPYSSQPSKINSAPPKYDKKTTPSTIDGNVSPYGGYKSKEEFNQALMPWAQKAAEQLKVPPEAILAQWGLETGYGRAGAVQGQFNYGNIQGTYTGNFEPGMDAGRNRNFVKYNSMQDFVDDYVRQLKNPRYNLGQENLASEQFFQRLKAGGYAEDPNYVATLTKITEGTKVASTPVQTNTNPRGSVLGSKFASYNEARRASKQMPATNVVNNTTNNNVAQSGGAGKPASAYDQELVKAIVSLVS